MNKVNNGDIIEDVSTNSLVSIGENNMQDMTENKTATVTKTNPVKNKTTKSVPKLTAVS